MFLFRGFCFPPFKQNSGRLVGERLPDTLDESFPGPQASESAASQMPLVADEPAGPPVDPNVLEVETVAEDEPVTQEERRRQNVEM